MVDKFHYLTIILDLIKNIFIKNYFVLLLNMSEKLINLEIF